MKFMKNLILTLTLVVMGIATQAHNILALGCGSNGRIKVKGTQFDYSFTKSDSVVLFITVNGQRNGTVKWKGSIFVVSGGTFQMDTVPYYNVNGETVFFTEYERNNTHSSYSVEYTGSGFIYGGCSAMPITLTSWTANVDANDSSLVHLAWSVDMESNVAYYRIDGSTDYGKTWDTGIARINSLGDTNLKRDYKKDYYNPLIGLIAKTAGFGGVGILLAIAIFAGSIRNRALAGTVACLLLVVTFACKKSVEAPKQGLKYNAVKLNEVDNDGSVKDFATRQLKH